MDIHADDTIVAVATPPGEAAIAVLRVSGPRALEIVGRTFHGRTRLEDSRGHTLHHGFLHSADGSVIDEVLVSVFREPASYTGEDAAEVSCHGGIVVADLVLKAILAAGARPARPGEFTKRAFLRGKLDLSQAEAVADLISSRSIRAQELSISQLQGKLGERVRWIRDRLLDACSLLEIDLDFSEEGLSVVSRQDTLQVLVDCQKEIQSLLSTFETGRVLRDGVRVVLLGPPNAGKSSLFNALLGNTRAIVSETPGTTRDYIEESVSISGVLFSLVDTAGMREAQDAIEAQGVSLTREVTHGCDIALIVLDRTGIPDGRIDQFLSNGLKLPEHVVVALNKTDLFTGRDDMTPRLALGDRDIPGIPVSALTGDGLMALRRALFMAVIKQEDLGETGIRVTSKRHQRALEMALRSLESAIQSMSSGATSEFVALDVRGAMNAAGEITGEITTDDVLDEIFSRFCIGK